MDEKQARSLLRLNENASKKDIEKKYSYILMRIKNGEDIDPKPYHKAYDVLMGKTTDDLKKRGKISKAYNKFMVDYKGWGILVLMSLTIVAMIVIPLIFKTVPDLVVAFAGKYSLSDDTLLREIIEQELPELDEIIVETMYMDKEGESGEFDMGGRTRLTALILTEEADILIMDSSSYTFVFQDNSLMVLDEIIADFDFTIDEKNYIYGIDPESGEKKIYGINVEGKDLVERTVYGTKQKILCVAKRTHHLDDVLVVMKIILTSGE